MDDVDMITVGGLTFRFTTIKIATRLDVLIDSEWINLGQYSRPERANMAMRNYVLNNS